MKILLNQFAKWRLIKCEVILLNYGTVDFHSFCCWYNRGIALTYHLSSPTEFGNHLWFGPIIFFLVLSCLLFYCCVYLTLFVNVITSLGKRELVALLFVGLFCDHLSKKTNKKKNTKTCLYKYTENFTT